MGTSSKTSTSKVKMIPVENLAGELGLAELDLVEILEKVRPPVSRDHMDRPTVPYTMLATISHLPEYDEAYKKGAIRSAKLRGRLNMAGALTHLRKQRADMLDACSTYISDLEHIHRHYITQANTAGHESPAMAIYLLTNRVLCTLRMMAYCLHAGYWYSGSLLREIDECLDVAKYFFVTQETDEGAIALHRWFRENHAPSHSACRAAISDWHSKVVPRSSATEFRSTMDELYDKKSKWTHPVFLGMREVAIYDP